LKDLLSEDGEENRIWLDQVKGIGSQDNYERIEYIEFNKAEIEALRGILDDIASEVGHRIKKTDLTSGGKSLTPETMTPSEIAERVAAILKEKNANRS
jgi:hypothetical protein